jgi:hypothetical protein
VRSWSCCAGLVLGVWASSVHAEPAPVWVWYRNSEGCPDGSSFVARLAELGQAARLAGVGDRVDFVVTLGRVADSSSGRLERQTHGGTVAIREYRDARCEQVAEALALTLDLALEPDASPPVVAVAPTADPGLDAAAAQTPASAEQRAPSWRVGPQALLQSGVAPQPAFGGALFAGVEDPGWFVRQLRAALFLLHGQGQVEARELSVSLLGIRLEACPVAWSARGVAFYPCAGADLGALHAAGSSEFGRSDTGFWAAALAHGRGVFELGSGLALEAQLGGALPLVKYEMGPVQGRAAWFRTPALGWSAGLGMAWRVP